MISVATLFDYAVMIALGSLCLSFLITIYRIVKGPTLPDRILGLDMLVAIAIGFIAVIGIKTGYTLYVDVAIALGLVGFLATVAFARFDPRRRGRADDAGARRDRGLPSPRSDGRGLGRDGAVQGATGRR